MRGRLAPCAVFFYLLVVPAAGLISCRVATTEEVLAGGNSGTAAVRGDELFSAGEDGETVLITFDERYLNGGKGYTLWTLEEARGGLEFEAVEVTVQKMSGDSRAGYGVAFCAQERGGKQHMLVALVNCEQQYQLGKVIGGSYRALHGWKTGGSLERGYAANTIQIRREGGQFVLSFNGQEAERFSDSVESDLNSGRLGYVAVISPHEDFPHVPVEIRYTKRVQ